MGGSVVVKRAKLRYWYIFVANWRWDARISTWFWLSLYVNFYLLSRLLCNFIPIIISSAPAKACLQNHPFQLYFRIYVKSIKWTRAIFMRLHLIDNFSFTLPDGTVNTSTSVRNRGAFLRSGSVTDGPNHLVRSCYYQRIKSIHRVLTTSAANRLL